MRHPISGCPPEFIGFSPNSLTVKMEIEMTNPCPSCVETIADLKQAVSDAIHNAYVSGALDVHNNYQEDRDPSFGEAAADYVASLGVEDILAHFLPKSPAQAIAEECPHGMTEEAAQWVLDRLEQERKDECSTIPNLTKPTTDTDYVAVPRDVLGAACYIIRKSEHAESKTAETLREYALATPTDPALHTKIATSAEIIALLDDPEINNAVRISGDNNQVPQGISETAYRQWLADGGESGLGGPENFQAELDKDVADPAPRYVFGPAIRVTELPANTEYRLTGTEAVYKFSVINQGWRVPTSLCRAYRIGQSHPHDGGECPLADGSARVYSTLDDGSTYQGPASERQHCWPSVASFIPIDEGKGS